MPADASSFSGALKRWRVQRRFSQLDLAGGAAISSRHLSFLETGRARPSREMVIRLSEALEVPLRERNRLLLAAGFSPQYEGRSLSDPSMLAVDQAVDLVLSAHAPWPALAVDRLWRLRKANDAFRAYLEGVAEAELAAPVNVLRLSLSPSGLGPRIVNHGEWKTHILHRLRRNCEATNDLDLQRLLDELAALPSPEPPKTRTPPPAPAGVMIPLVLRTRFGEISMFTTTTVFGTPLDVTVEELAIECFFPADPQSADRMRRLQTPGQGGSI